MQCISIHGVKFDHKNISSIEEIKRKNSLSVMLSRAMPFGTMANIFLGNKVAISSFNIYQTDFEALAKALAALPAIQRRVIQDIARRQAVYHIGQQAKFWRGVADGCEIK